MQSDRRWIGFEAQEASQQQLSHQRHGRERIERFRLSGSVSFSSNALVQRRWLNCFLIFTETDVCTDWQECENQYTIPALFSSLPPCPCTYPTGKFHSVHHVSNQFHGNVAPLINRIGLQRPSVGSVAPASLSVARNQFGERTCRHLPTGSRLLHPVAIRHTAHGTGSPTVLLWRPQTAANTWMGGWNTCPRLTWSFSAPE